MICSNIEVDVYFVGIQPARIELTEQISERVERAIDFLGEILTEIFSKERKIR
jgi:Ni,Fe-hydrogenase maturation factor